MKFLMKVGHGADRTFNFKNLPSDLELNLLGLLKLDNHKSNWNKLINDKLMCLGISIALMG